MISLFCAFLYFKVILQTVMLCLLCWQPVYTEDQQWSRRYAKTFDDFEISDEEEEVPEMETLMVMLIMIVLNH